MDSNTVAILERLDLIQRELDDIRRMLMAGSEPATTLKGILKGMTIRDEDLEEAKRSWDRKLDDV